MNIAELVALHGRFRANKPAIVDSAETLTFAALDDRARRIATLLHREGVRPGDVVGASLIDGVDIPAVWLAVARLGAVNLPMDWRWTPAEQERIGRIFRPKLVIAEAGRRIAPGLPAISHDENWRQAVAAAPAWDRMAPGDDEVFILILSSGTTGVPQANVYTHRNYGAMAAAYWADVGVGENDRYLSVLPIAFAAGRGMALATLLRGGTLHLMPPLFQAKDIVAAIAQHRIDTISVVPSIARMLLAEAPADGLLLSQLRLFATVGAVLFPEENRAIRARLTPNLVDYYGSAGGGMNAIMRPHEHDLKPGSIGRPMLGNAIEIVDERDRPVPAGETGILRCRSLAMTRGIYPPDPADRSIRDGWHYPGDYAYIDDDGYVFLQGRWNDVIIRGGMNVFAPEVERVLLSAAGVREAAVLGAKSDRLGEEVAAFLVTEGAIDERAILRHCRTHLAPYKVPSIIRTVDELPRNSAGKVVKATLAESLLNRSR
ncbi:MAG: AMP-binding protein [Rhodospirillaceae bacterium]|nr:AMP-binding protein [Rhodospirillaceae bacterium]